MTKCLKCKKAKATHELHCSVMCNDGLDPAQPRIPTNEWSMTIVCCRGCAAGIATELTGSTVGAPDVSKAN